MIQLKQMVFAEIKGPFVFQSILPDFVIFFFKIDREYDFSHIMELLSCPGFKIKSPPI